MIADPDERVPAAGDTKTVHVRKVEPRAVGWRTLAWGNGVFDAGHRPPTNVVEGTIRIPYHLVLVTIDGGAERLEVTSACGHRYEGSDRRGAVSFVPAHCERQLKMSGVRSAWASISFRPELLDRAALDVAGGAGPLDVATFTNGEDPFVAGLVTEFARLHAEDGGLDPTYCDAMSWALAHYVARRYGGPSAGTGRRPRRLPTWRMRRIAEYVDAHVDRDIRIADLATLVGVSPGHLHRAFRATTGVTPLEFILRTRIRRAAQILVEEPVPPVPIVELALRVGFQSPSHFTRTFRRVTGSNPSSYRARTSLR